MAHPVTLVALAGVGLVLGLSGPFGTLAHLSLPARIAYWLGMAAATYGAGLLIGESCGRALAHRRRAVRFALSAALTIIAVLLIVLTLNRAVFGAWLDAGAAPAFLGAVAAITLTVTALLEFVRVQLPGQSTDTPVPPPILDRLPLDKRGALVALSVEDHYVRVRTTRGTELVLMRLSDAIRETGGTQGDQVHRSHWVAWEAVRAARRTGDRALLTLNSGDEIPVSRANLWKLKEAGLLPR